jgi:hypothetical protein
MRVVSPARSKMTLKMSLIWIPFHISKLSIMIIYPEIPKEYAT